MVIDLAARTADTVGPLARGAGRPEVLVLVEELETVFRQADLVGPNIGGLLVVVEDGRRQRGGVEPQPLLFGQELPRPVDRLALEVIAEAEVPKHLEEGVVIRRPADVIDVAGAKALLTGRRAGEL